MKSKHGETSIDFYNENFPIYGSNNTLMHAIELARKYNVMNTLTHPHSHGRAVTDRQTDRLTQFPPALPLEVGLLESAELGRLVEGQLLSLGDPANHAPLL